MSKLDDRRKRYDIPAPAYLPIGKNVLIFRIPAEEKTAGGLYVPDDAKPVYSRGILLSAGLAARDILADGLIEIGDEVCFAHFAGRDREKTERQSGGVAKKIAEMKIEDVLGSVDALDRASDYDVVYDEEVQGRVYKRKGK